MRIAKHEHACMIVSKSNASIVIDPGTFTTPMTDIAGVVAVIITHEHADHWTPEQLGRILERNPKARIFGPAGVVAAASDFEVEQVEDGDELSIEPFALRFFGSKHAVIHESIPVIDNVAVLVDDTFYYAGDSYTVPPVAVETLAAPIGAPWLKISEAMDFVMAVKPARAFPVHESTLSRIGQNMANDRLDYATRQGGGEFIVLDAGASIDL